MPEKRIEGVKVKESPHKKWQYDYGLGDVKALYNRGNWQNWNQEIKWLEEHGEADNELTPGETIAMVEDLRSLQAAHAPFTADPNEAYKMAHKYRARNNQRFAKEHAQHVRPKR